MPLLAVVPNCRKLDCRDTETGLLLELPHDALRRGLVHIGPSARQSPKTIADFAYHEDAATDERRATDIHLRCCVPEVLPKELENPLAVCAASLGHQRRGELPDPLIALPIEGVVRVGNSTLRYGLQLARDRQPGRFGHVIRIVAASHGSHNMRNTPPAPLGDGDCTEHLRTRSAGA